MLLFCSFLGWSSHFSFQKGSFKKKYECWPFRIPISIPISILRVSSFQNGLCDTGWRRCRGCLKLLVSFCKRAINYRALWRKTPCKDKAGYVSSPSCIYLELYETYLRVSCVYVYVQIYTCMSSYTYEHIYMGRCACVYMYLYTLYMYMYVF